MSLPLGLSLLVVPWLVSVRVGLPHVLQRRVDDRFADEDAQVDHQVGVHRPAGGDREQLIRYSCSSGKNLHALIIEMNAIVV